MRILQGNQIACRLTQSSWANILLTLEDWGWRPRQLRTCYLASDVAVDSDDAAEMASAGRRLMDALLADPLRHYAGLRADMGKLAEVVMLCEEGQFVVSNDPS